MEVGNAWKRSAVGVPSLGDATWGLLFVRCQGRGLACRSLRRWGILPEKKKWKKVAVRP